MDIDDMKIGDAKRLAKMFGGGSSECIGSNLIGEKVIVRAYRAGVHFGTLVAINGEHVELKNARRLWYWKVKDSQGVSLSDVAEHGLHEDSKICALVSTQIIVDACELMTTSAAAQQSIEGTNDYHP